MGGIPKIEAAISGLGYKISLTFVASRRETFPKMSRTHSLITSFNRLSHNLNSLKGVI